jgi:uncharacterized protein YndB with AHSA1/START domain
MSQMKQQVRIYASPSTVYQSPSTEAGLRAWWTSDMIVEPRVGSIAEFSHGEEGTHLRARVVELVPDNQVVWDCLGEHEEWKGTRITWRMEARGSSTERYLIHSDWVFADGWFGTLNAIWGALLYRLKDYAEGKTPGPFFKGKA